jgi:hypothetical protein
MYKTLKKGTRGQKYKKFLHEVARNWIMEQGEVVDSSSDEDNAVPFEKRPTPRWPPEDLPGRLSEILAGEGHGKKKYSVRQCRVCSVHKKRSETRYSCEFCVVPLHKGSCFEKYHTLKHYQTIRVLKTPVTSHCTNYNREM